MGEILQQALGNILLAVLIPIATAIGMLLGRLLKKAINRIDNEVIQGVCWQAVLFAEQKFEQLHGKAKFDKAYEYAASKLPGVSGEDISAGFVKEHLSFGGTYISPFGTVISPRRYKWTFRFKFSW